MGQPVVAATLVFKGGLISGGMHQTTRGNNMSGKQQFWPDQIWKGRFLAFFAIPLMLGLCASAPPVPLPFQLSISPPDSDSFVVITAFTFSNDEYSKLILQVNTNLTTTNWVNIQTNIGVSAGSSTFSYKMSRAQGPTFFRVAAILN
jgi:hypothetical protein